MNPGQHYDRADELLEQGEAQVARLRESMAAGNLGMNDTEVALLLVSMTFNAAQVHATLATVIP